MCVRARLRVCERGSAAAAAAAATRPDGRRGSGWSRLRRDANKSCCLKLNIFSPLLAARFKRNRRRGRTDAGHRQRIACLKLEVAVGDLGDLLNHWRRTFRPLKCCGWNFHFGLDEGLLRKDIVASRLCLILLNATEQQMNVSTPSSRASLTPHAALMSCPSPPGLSITAVFHQFGFRFALQ